MKYAIFLLVAFGILTPVAGRAQGDAASFTSADMTKVVAIQDAMLKVIGEIQNNFEKFKGDFLKKSAEGNSYYAVKDLDMETSTQYIMVNAKGVSVYIAIFSPNKLDTKLPFFGVAAFSGLDNKYGFTVKKEDTDKTNGMLKYSLKFGSLQPASFMLDVVKIQGTLIVANQ